MLLAFLCLPLSCSQESNSHFKGIQGTVLGQAPSSEADDDIIYVGNGNAEPIKTDEFKLFNCSYTSKLNILCLLEPGSEDTFDIDKLILVLEDGNKLKPEETHIEINGNSIIISHPEGIKIKSVQTGLESPSIVVEELPTEVSFENTEPVVTGLPEESLSNAPSETPVTASGCGSIQGDGSWILVPGDPIYSTNDFCVMKYEAKCSVEDGQVCNLNSETPNSAPESTPWVNIS